MAEPYTTSISNTAIEKINNWMLQQKAAGKKVEPWELESAMKAALSTEADRASANYFKGRSLNLEEQRMTDARQAQADATSASKTSGMVGTGMNALLLNQMMADKTTGTTPLGDLARWGKNKVNPTDTPGSNPATPGGQPPGTNPTDMPDWNPVKNTGMPSGPSPTYEVPPEITGPEVYPANTVDATGNLVEAGTATGEAGAGLAGTQGAIDAASGLSGADLAAMTGENAMAGGTAGVGGAGAGTGMSFGSIATPIGYIAAAEGARNLWGGQGIDFEDKTKQQRTVDSPATTGMLASIAPWTLVGGESDSGPWKEMSRIERQVMSPIDKLFGGCIIVTVCTSSDSEEVNIAREYRDQFLDDDQLRGYYIVAEKIVPLLNANKTIRRMVKKALVDRLVDYGAVALGKKPKMALRSSWIVSWVFLSLIRAVGKTRTQFVRANGEVF